MLLEKSKEWKKKTKLKTHTVKPITLSEYVTLCVISIEGLKPSVVFFFHKLQIIWPWISSVLKPTQIHLLPWLQLYQIVNQQTFGVPPPFSCVWPPPSLGLVLGCPVEPSRMPGHHSWMMSDRKYKLLIQLLLPTFSSTFTGIQEMDSCTAPHYVYYLQQHLQLFNLLREKFWDQLLCLLKIRIMV